MSFFHYVGETQHQVPYFLVVLISLELLTVYSIHYKPIILQMIKDSLLYMF